MSNDEPIVLGAAAEELSRGEIGKISSEPISDAEVSGRGVEIRMVKCGYCARVGYIYRTGPEFRAYQCPSCYSVRQSPW